MNLANFMSELDKVEPNTNLNILITGLALGHFDEKSKQWKIFFPKAPNHNFKMIVRKRNFEGEVLEENTFELFQANKDFETAGKIEVITNQKYGGGSFDPDLIKGIVDLSILHGEPLPLTSEKSKYAGFLLLNQANLEAKRDSEMKQEIWKVKPYPLPTSKTLISRDTAKTMFGCGTNFKPGLKTEIRVESKLGFNVVLTHEKDVNYQIVFDNDCHACAESDFKFYYDIIDEKKLKEKIRFETNSFSEDDKAPRGSCLGGGSNRLIIPDGLI